MKKWILIGFLYLISGQDLLAQDETAKNGVYLEIAGNGILYSINYERFISPDFSIRAGFGSFSAGGTLFIFPLAVSVTTFPILGNFYLGTGSNKLELGAGVLLGTSKVVSGWNNEEEERSTIFDLTAVAGYRYQNPAGGFIFRVGLTPFLSVVSGEDSYLDEGFTLSGGLSVGYAF